MNVLHLLAPAPFGGLESVVRGLAAGQQRRCDRVTVAASLSPGDPEPAFLSELSALGVEIEVLRVAGKAYAPEVSLVRGLCRKLAPDVAHTHGYRSDLVAGHAASREHIPLVTTVHGFTTGDFKNQLYQAVQRLAYRRFDAVVAVSRRIAERVRRWGAKGERLHVIQNAYIPAGAPCTRDQARAVLGIAEPCFRFGWVGRINRDKALDVLVEALALLQDLDWRLSVIGDGRDREPVRTRAQELGLAARLDWHGALPSAGRLMSAFDACVLSSRTEGTPMVLLEAMAAGTPVVATSVGGVPDVVGPDEALLVPGEDLPALATALRALVQDPEQARARSAAASVRLGAFDRDLWVERYAEVYRAAGATRRTRHGG